VSRPGHSSKKIKQEMWQLTMYCYRCRPSRCHC